jgi:hypothetical protein
MIQFLEELILFTSWHLLGLCLVVTFMLSSCISNGNEFSSFKSSIKKFIFDDLFNFKRKNYNFLPFFPRNNLNKIFE